MNATTETPAQATERKRVARSRLNVLITLLSMAALVGGFFVWRSWKKPKLDRYDKAIAMLATHQLRPNSGGFTDLSKAFPGLAERDEVAVDYRDDGSFAAMFPTYFGEGDEMAGLLYTSRPLTEDDTLARTHNAIHFDERMISVGPYHFLLLDEKINPQWYHVSYKLH